MDGTGIRHRFLGDPKKIEFHEGDRVYIDTESQYYMLGDMMNPMDVVGVLMSIKGDDMIYDHNYEVRWSNGNTNQYTEEDLRHE